MDEPAKHRVFIIAEMANAHEGDPATARSIVEAAAEAEADAVKFQVFTPDELAVPTHPDYPLYRKLSMSGEDWRELVDRAHALGMSVLSDVFGLDSARQMGELGVDGFKVHAADASNYELLKYIAAMGRSVVLSVGGAIWTETADSLAVLRQAGARSIVLMYGFQGYPNDLTDSCLRRIETLREKFALPVGFASHLGAEQPEAVSLPVWAVAAGAEFIEEHITLDRSEKGIDYYSSLEPTEFRDMVRRIRAMEPTLGERSFSLLDREKEYRLTHKKWAVAMADIPAGEMLTVDNVDMKIAPSPPQQRPLSTEMALGHRAARDISAFSAIRMKDITMKVAAALACRAESERLYGKPLQVVGDRTILDHLIDRLRESKLLDEIVLAISEGPSCQVFCEFAEQRRLRYVLGPEKDVLARLIAAGEEVRADLILRATTENPYTYWENVDDLILAHIENNADLTVTEKLPLGTDVEIISMDALRKSHKHGEDRHRSELCTLFIAENPDVFSIQRILAPENLRRPDIRLTVDTPNDLILARTLWEALHREGELLTLEEIMRHLDAFPDLAKINQGPQTLNLWGGDQLPEARER